MGNIGYHLTPVSASEWGISTACMMECMVTGAILSGSGGGGYFISPEVFELLTGDIELQNYIRQKIATHHDQG